VYKNLITKNTFGIFYIFLLNLTHFISYRKFNL